MPKITSVEPQKKNLHRFNVFLDGQFAFGADEDLMVNRRLVIGKVITPEELPEILFEAEVGKLMERMYRWFSLRQHSEKEVRDYFRIKNYESIIKGKEEISQLVIDALIETLKKKGVVNDVEFAKAWVEARRNSKQKGIRAIKAELYQKGIDKEIIEEVLRLVFDREDFDGELSRTAQTESADARSGQVSEEDLAKLALEKKMRAWKNLSALDLKKKAYEFLMRRGFDYEIIKTVLDKSKDDL